MKEIPHKLFRFLFPFIIITLFILIIDPYNLFNVISIVSDDNKSKCLAINNWETSRPNAIWRTLKFRNEPTPNIVLGDSRIAYVSDACLEEKLGGIVSNLAIPGSNIKTITELFWMAANSTTLENVIIQLNFNRYNDNIKHDLLIPVWQLINKPHSFFFNVNYVKDSFDVLFYSLRKNNHSVSLSYYGDNIWKLSEKSIINDFRGYGYVYPENYLNELKKISTYCNDENINLLFVIAPNYFTVHQYVEKFNLEEEYQRFKTDLGLLSATIDLDYGLPISFNKDMYRDHFHFKPHLADTLISLIYP